MNAYHDRKARNPHQIKREESRKPYSSLIDKPFRLLPDALQNTRFRHVDRRHR